MASVTIDVRDEITGTVKAINKRRFSINIGPYDDPNGLTFMLLTFGTLLAMIGLGAPIYSANPCSKASIFISTAYVASLLVIFLYGIGLIGLSFWIPQAPHCRVGISKTAAPIPIYRARIAKAFLLKSFAPFLLVVTLGFIAHKLED